MADYTKDEIIDIVATVLQVENKKELSDKLKDVKNVGDLTNSFLTVAKDKFETVKTLTRKQAKKELYGRATREERSKIEKLLAENLDIEIDTDLETTVSKLPTLLGSKSDNSKSKNKAITKEQALQNEYVRSLVEELKSQVSQKENELENLNKEFKGQQLDYVLQSKIPQLLQESNAKLSDKPNVRNAQIKAFKLLLKAENDIQLNDDGSDIVIMNGDGMRLMKDDTNPMQLLDVVKQSWIGDTMDPVKDKQKQRNPNPSENSYQNTDFGFSGDDPVLQDSNKMLELQKQAIAKGDKEKADFLKTKILEISANE